MSLRAIGKGTLTASLVSLCVSAASAAEPFTTVTVDCARGETIAKALARGNENKPLLVLVSGNCNESVIVERSGVTLRGESGGAINGPDPNVNTLTVRADDVTIEALTVSGGRNGITGLGAARLSVLGATVQSTGRNGVTYALGSNGTVDNCTIQSNGRDGVSVDGSAVTVINSTISGNARNGVLVGVGGAARIGVDNRNGAAGNFIRQNGSSGIVIATGGYGLIAMNEITGNGVDPALPRSGISVVEARADIVGGNVVTGHPAQGLFARGSSVQIGGPLLAPGFPTVNTFSGNGNAASPGGIFAFLGSALVIRDAVISGNNGPGLTFFLRSHGQIFSSTIQGNLDIGTCPPVPGGFCNFGDGIRLTFGSALLPSAPPGALPTVVSGNAGFGISCTDGESSIVNTGLPSLSISGNALGDPPAGCTGF